MRFKQFKPRTLTEADLQQLNELRMNPTTLQQFGSSDEAKGIMAGFEAELVFTGLGGDSYDDEYDMEPDMDADERCGSIQQIMDFFENDEWGYGIHGRDADKLQEGLDEMYWEWHEDQMYEAFRDEAEELIKKVIEEDDFDWEDETRKQLDMMDLSDDEIEEAMKQGTGAPKFDRSSEQEEYALANPGYQRYLEAREQAEGLLDDLVQDSLVSQDKNYDAALDEFRDNFYIDDDSGFFSDVGLRWMSDVQDKFELMWPVMTGTGSSNEGGFSEDNAEKLADDLHEKLGVRTKVSSGYHSAKRDNVTWIFEPDSSLDSDDSDNMPVEIVSPPMPLEECLTKMEQFFEWAEENGAYANSSTGFHMGVSLPHRGGDVDYVKLALFLGDEHVLREFGRSGNHFCEAAIKKIRGRVKGNKEAVGSALELMKHNLLELAQKALEINNHGFGKYTSINPQGGTDARSPHNERGAKYIEFRSAGGSNYFEDIDKLKNTLLRYAQAMTIAANPAAERREYYKKLYKLISPPEGDPAIDLFARFATGEIDSEQLKRSWADKQLEKEPTGDWVLYDSDGKRVQGHTYNGYTKSEAWEKAKEKLSPGSSMEGFQKAYKFLPSNSESGDWEVYNTETGKTLEVLRGYESRGRAADAVYDKYADQKIPFNLRPVDTNAPEPELTKRERLAKNIKAQGPAPKVYYKWNIANPKSGENDNDYMTRERVFQTTKKVEKENPKAGKYNNTIVGKGSAQLTSKNELRDIDEMSFDFRVKGSDDVIEYKRFSRASDSINGLTCPVVVAIERANELSEKLGKPVVAYEVPAKAVSDLQSTLRTWEIVDRMDNNKVLDTVGGTEAEAERVRQGWVQRAGRGEDSNIGKRSVPNDASRERYEAGRGTWEFFYEPTGRILDRVTDASEPQARAVLADVQRRYSDLAAPSIQMRKAVAAQDTDINVAQNFAPAGFQTQRPATGDYYEVRSGDRVYGYVSTQAATDNTRSMAIEVKTYINELTGRDDAQLVYKSGDPVQAVDGTGELIWQIYERSSGHVIEEILAANQQEAWTEAQGYLRDIGAEDPSLFSLRPKMES
ncbi:Putative amidoligase enzyme [uncultured Caudovirales phage]|uniref:Amidoligase enzyme n=1 Tax=uncultured Caudovirales phage TaxID=2100421 RepID=A0A6J5LC14_9CAUD|nr:Putative amidoligase enzyme [uncultured Caudovirales phage]